MNEKLMRLFMYASCSISHIAMIIRIMFINHCLDNVSDGLWYTILTRYFWFDWSKLGLMATMGGDDIVGFSCESLSDGCFGYVNEGEISFVSHMLDDTVDPFFF